MVHAVIRFLSCNGAKSVNKFNIVQRAYANINICIVSIYREYIFKFDYIPWIAAIFHQGRVVCLRRCDDCAAVTHAVCALFLVFVLLDDVDFFSIYTSEFVPQSPAMA